VVLSSVQLQNAHSIGDFKRILSDFIRSLRVTQMGKTESRWIRGGNWDHTKWTQENVSGRAIKRKRKEREDRLLSRPIVLFPLFLRSFCLCLSLSFPSFLLPSSSSLFPSFLLVPFSLSLSLSLSFSSLPFFSFPFLSLSLSFSSSTHTYLLFSSL
jgi:hypothetical protein